MWLATTPVVGAEPDDAIKRGEYVFRAAAGCSCHTDVGNDGRPLAGGRELKTPFGTFYSPNITPDTSTGIGAWREGDFVRAMTEGLSPDGEHYFPAFPYPSYTRMSESDLRDLWAFLVVQPAVEQQNDPHDLIPPFGWRWTVGLWKQLYFDRGPLQPDPSRSAEWNRGAYFVTGPGHCGECHTPRNWLGAPDAQRYLAGSADGADGEAAPNITPDPDTGIGRWQAADLAWLLRMGLKPDGDNVQGPMAEAIAGGYRYLSNADREAIAAYLLALPPLHSDGD